MGLGVRALMPDVLGIGTDWSDEGSKHSSLLYLVGKKVKLLTSWYSGTSDTELDRHAGSPVLEVVRNDHNLGSWRVELQSITPKPPPPPPTHTFSKTCDGVCPSN